MSRQYRARRHASPVILLAVLAVLGNLLLLLGCQDDLQAQEGQATGTEVCVALRDGDDRVSILAREALRRGLKPSSRVRKTVAIQLGRMLVTQIRKTIVVSESDIAERIRDVGLKKREEGKKPKRVWLLQIVTRRHEAAVEMHKELSAISNTQKRRSRFRELVRQSSVDATSKRRGGSVGFIEAQELGDCGKGVMEARRGALLGPCERSGAWYLWLKVKSSTHRRVVIHRHQPTTENVRRQIVEERTEAEVKRLLAAARRR